jgi:iron complex outermembrane receptor protein
VKVELTHAHRTVNNAYVSAGLECYLRQSHCYLADNTETPTPSYTLINLAAGTDILLHGKKWCELNVIVSNLFDRAYQSHLSRLKYADLNAVTGRMGVFNMGRNVTFKLLFPVEF